MRGSLRVVGDPPSSVISPALLIARQHQFNAFVLTLHGELDLTSSPLLEGELEDAEAAGETHVVIDLSGLEFMDSTGLTVLLAAQRRAFENGYALSVRHGRLAVRLGKDCLAC